MLHGGISLVGKVLLSGEFSEWTDGSMSDLKQKVAKGTVWTLCEKLSCQAVQFCVSMILARLLTPNDYGAVALTTIFFAVSNVLVDCGFGNALVQKKNSDDLDFNSVFYLNLALSIIAYVALFIAAPWIADFYQTPVLKNIVRVSAVCLFFNAINTVQNAELVKKMLFHLSFRISLVMTLVSAICGVTLALFGFGVWALVWSSLISGFVGVIARWFIIAWRPQLIFSFARLKPLFSYGWKMSVSAVLDQFFSNLNGLLIGKFYTKADLAFVNRGYSLPKLMMNEIDGTLGRVSFPALVQLQNDKIKLRDAMRRMMICSTFLVFPLMVGVAACAKSELRLLYGEQWVPATPYMMLACFSFALWPFHTINLKGIMALGRSDIFLKLEIIKKILKLVVIMVFFRFGVFPFMCACAFALGPLGVIVNSWPNHKLLDYPIRMQMMDVLPTAVLCVVEAIVVVGVGVVFCLLGLSYESTQSLWSLVAILFAQLLFGAGTYFGLSYAFRLKAMGEYARIVSVAVQGRFPKLANVLAKRFEV